MLCDMMSGFTMKSYHPPEVDIALLESVTLALQAQERFTLEVEQRQKPCPKLTEQAIEILQSLKSVKSKIEHSEVELECAELDQLTLQQLRALILMHVPVSLTPEIKTKIYELVTQVIKGVDGRVIYIELVTCPWYMSTQLERGQQAKHNSLLVVFTNPDYINFTPANAKSKQQREVYDQGWFYAAEAGHFAQYVGKGKSRFVEALFPLEGAVIYETTEWQKLHHLMDATKIIGLRGFLEQCRGQAIGGVGKKSRKSGLMKMRNGATLFEFCESFRLLQNAEDALTKGQLSVDTLSTERLSGKAREAQEMLTQFYQYESVSSTTADLFSILMSWKQDVDDVMKGSEFTPQKEVDDLLGRWLMSLRTDGQQLLACPGIPDGECDNVVDLLQKVGGPVARMSPENVVMIARAGSYLYGLSTPESDVDYVVVYTEPTEKLVSSVRPQCECIENRGPKLTVEYGAYEARIFAEMLLKGSVVISELIFVEGVDYASEAWKVLCSQRHLFMSEHLMLQYKGLIRNNMRTIESRKHMDSPREKKLFYQIFHKLWNLDALLHGRCPPVRCTGEVKEFIMRIRRGPLEGDLDRERLYALAKDKLQTLKMDLATRTVRLQENASLGFLTKWLLGLRGLSANTDGQPLVDRSDLRDHTMLSV